MKNNISKITIGILILLAFTNPTLTDFRDTFGKEIGRQHRIFYPEADAHRRYYFLFFSIYEEKHIGEEVKGKVFEYSDYNGEKIYTHQRLGFNYYKKTYLGILKNFITIKTVKTFKAAKKIENYSD